MLGRRRLFFMILKNGTVLLDDYTFLKTDVKVSGGKIAEIGKNLGGDEIVDLKGNYLLPGFIEEHFHGANGAAVLDCKKESFLKLSDFEATQGITTIVPTLSTYPDEVVFSCIESLKEAVPKAAGARILGLHLEGPFLSYDYRGAHDPAYLKTPSVDRAERFCNAGGDLIRIMTVAPELPDAANVIRFLKSRGVTVEIGHSAANYDEALRGIDAGATVSTHTFNAMAPLQHRNPGIVGAALTDDRIHCEVIADFGHVAPAVVKLIFKAKGDDRVNLVSDSMMCAGLPDGVYEMEEHRCTVKNGLSYFENGTINGSASTLLFGFQNLSKIGIPLESAVKSVSKNPAVSLKIDHECGSILPGKRADLVVMDKGLCPLATFVGGRKVFQKSSAF